MRLSGQVFPVPQGRQGQTGRQGDGMALQADSEPIHGLAQTLLAQRADSPAGRGGQVASDRQAEPVVPGTGPARGDRSWRIDRGGLPEHIQAALQGLHEAPP